MHARVISSSGGSLGVRDLNGLESAVAQPQMTFDRVDFYPTIATKAAALCHSLITNHPFIDGNKRVGHAAMEVMLMLNGYEIMADIDDQEKVIIAVASGALSREDFASWVERQVVELSDRAT